MVLFDPAPVHPGYPFSHRVYNFSVGRQGTAARPGIFCIAGGAFCCPCLAGSILV